MLKLYGLPARRVANDAARNRMQRFTLAGLCRELKLGRGRGRPRYFYPARGIGQLANALKEQFLDNGGRLVFVARIDRLRGKEGRGVEAIDLVRRDGGAETLQTHAVVSSIPLDALYELAAPLLPCAHNPSFDLQWRGLRLLYLITPDKVSAEHETYYFPEPHILFGRLSEINKYSPFLNADGGRAALTLEIPCSPNDATWEAPDDRLAARCMQELQRLGIVRETGPRAHDFFSRKIPKAYPVYDLGWQARFQRICQRLDSLANLYLVGRSALFLHCNLDHCMTMGLQLAQHLGSASPDQGDWHRIQRGFFNYRLHE